MNCEICGVKMALYTEHSKVCTHCDMHLDEGYTEDEIKKLLQSINDRKNWEEKWAEQKLNELFETQRFIDIGKGDDYTFQVNVFLGEASRKLSIARTILKNNNVAVDPEKMKEMLDMQTWVHDFSQYLREGSK